MAASIAVKGKQFLQHSAPGLYRFVSNAWHKKKGQELEARLNRIQQTIVREHGNRVLSGPFAGMLYEIPRAIDSVITPKQIGSYEAEVHDVIERIVKTDYPH